MKYFVSITLTLFVMCTSFNLDNTKTNSRQQKSVFMSVQVPKPVSIKLSPMVENMAVSKTIEIHGMTKEMEKNGQTVFSLCVGEPDYEPPIEVIEATYKAAKDGKTKYTSVNGDAALRQAIAQDLTKRKGTAYTADQIVVSNGAKQSVIQTLLSIVSPGDKVLIPSPYWVSYIDMVKMCSGVPVVVETFAEKNYQLTAETLRQALSSDPKITSLILCNPSNPTGCVADKKTLLEIAKVLEDFPNVIIISDEIYERLTYNVPHTAFASLPNMYDRTVTINGFSKSHSMTGFRVGYSASNMIIAKANSKIQGQMTSCASSVSQYAALVALTNVSDQWMKDRVLELQDKRDFAYDLLLKIPNIKCPKPDGAFYLLPDISYYYNRYTKSGKPVSNSHELCLELLRDEGVALVSGDAFGANNCLRISYAASKETIEGSLVRLSKFLSSLSATKP